MLTAGTPWSRIRSASGARSGEPCPRPACRSSPARISDHSVAIMTAIIQEDGCRHRERWRHPVSQARRSSTGTAAAAAQVALELRRDGVAALLGDLDLRVAALLQRPHVVAHVLVLVRHLADGPLPLLRLLGQRAERHL